jgi:hypothetical protein
MEKKNKKPSTMKDFLNHYKAMKEHLDEDLTKK